MNKEEQCRTSEKNGKLLHDIFFNKLSLRSCPEIPRGSCVCLLLSPSCTEVTILSTYQRMVCVARTYRHPFRRLSTPTEEYCKTRTARYGSVRITATFGGGSVTRAVPLQTEPTHTLWWKCAISNYVECVPIDCGSFVTAYLCVFGNKIPNISDKTNSKIVGKIEIIHAIYKQMKRIHTKYTATG